MCLEDLREVRENEQRSCQRKAFQAGTPRRPNQDRCVDCAVEEHGGRPGHKSRFGHFLHDELRKWRKDVRQDHTEDESDESTHPLQQEGKGGFEKDVDGRVGFE